MNTKIKIAAGMAASLVAGTMLVGTAVAAPQATEVPTYNGYNMMRSSDTTDTFGMPTVAQMNPFMEQYRTADGSIDVSRMHSDMTSGTVTPPHTRKAWGLKGAASARSIRASSRHGLAMRSLWSRSRTGNGMMGSNR